MNITSSLESRQPHDISHGNEVKIQQTTSVFGLPADLEEALTNENNPRNLDATIALAEGIQRSPKCAQG